MSSLTRKGPHTVTCIPKVVVGKDRTGSNKLGPGPSTTFKGVYVAPAGLAAFGQAEDVRSGGTVVNADYVIMKALEPVWPGGPHSTIVWDGVEYDQVGEARTYSRGRMTRHQIIKMKARSVEVR